MFILARWCCWGRVNAVTVCELRCAFEVVFCRPSTHVQWWCAMPCMWVYFSSSAIMCACLVLFDAFSDSVSVRCVVCVSMLSNQPLAPNACRCIDCMCTCIDCTWCGGLAIVWLQWIRVYFGFVFMWLFEYRLGLRTLQFRLEGRHLWGMHCSHVTFSMIAVHMSVHSSFERCSACFASFATLLETMECWGADGTRFWWRRVFWFTTAFAVSVLHPDAFLMLLGTRGEV